jgi:BspA type Leucine rich repeat region (6 copies)
VLRRVALTLTVVLVLVGFVHVASAQATTGMSTVDCTTDSLQTGWFTIEDATHTVTANYGCAGDAVIPSGVTAISDMAFESATGLTSITIPSSVGEIGNDAFDGTDHLTSLFFEGNAPLLDSPGDTFDTRPQFDKTAYHFSNATGFTSGSWGKVSDLILALYLPVPPAPTAIAGVGSATISVQAAAIGPPPTSFTITSSPGAATCTVTGASGSCAITGLTNGASYTFTTVAHEGPTNSAVSAESAAVVPTALKPPSAPEHIAWHIPHRVNQKLVANFPAAGSTTYTIFGTLQSSKRLHPRAHTTAHGTCRVTTNATTQTSTAKCTIRFSRSGTWLITITPTQSGLVGMPTTKRVKIYARRPARTPQPAEPVTG